MYANGTGVRRDHAEAFKLFRLAADQGYTDAQFDLAGMYADGDGVLQSNVGAHMWFNLASANGNTRAGKLRDEIAAVMTPAEVSEAHMRARVCMASNYQDCD